jgi:hypothetical protein
MGKPHISFHRLESYLLEPQTGRAAHEKDVPDIICSFETKQYGYFKIGCSLTVSPEGKTQLELNELDEEPSLYLLTESAQAYVERVMYISWRMVYDVAAETDRFK